MPQPTVEQLLQLLNYCESFAKQMLADSAEFYPFGAFINANGQIEALGAHLGTEHPNSQDVYGFLRDAIAQMIREEKVIAYGIAANVDVPPKLGSPFADGIRIHIEAPAYSRYIYTPYRLLQHRAIRRFLAFLPIVEFSESITVDLDPTLFPASVG